MESAPVSAAYPANRAAALAGVPLSTLHYWARTELVVPSVSHVRVKMWSYADLLVLRLVDWLRQDQPDVQIPKASMKRIRQQLSFAEGLGEKMFTDGIEVWVDQSGRLHFQEDDQFYVSLGKGLSQEVMDTKVNLVRPIERQAGLRGPDLVMPAPSLRIVPGKLSGEPHVADTRIPTHMLSALSLRGFGDDRIREMYSVLNVENVVEALALENQLEENLHARAS